ncbi:hypothetical protein [Ornithinimicrobium sp. W1665]|uniref:hypothetical protein n=1 Tax=Ornithinimicrobium sp. W1665 TaxID=3416666 RepID=UPI003CFB4A2D
MGDEGLGRAGSGGPGEGADGPPGSRMDGELAPVPSLAQLRAAVRRGRVHIGTGWPLLDLLGGGLVVGTTTVVAAPAQLRAQVLGRIAAWAAGESWRTVLASTLRSREELLLDVAAGGLGLSAAALMESDLHDAWLDARMRVLDLSVHGGATAAADFAETMESRRPTVAVVDGYDLDDDPWDEVLHTRASRVVMWPPPSIEPAVYPLRHRCALVVGLESTSMRPTHVADAASFITFVPRDEFSRVDVAVTTDGRRQTRTVLLRDRLLPPPRSVPAQLRRRGVVNIWEERLPQEIDRFAGILGADAFDVEHVPDEDPTGG